MSTQIHELDTFQLSAKPFVKWAGGKRQLLSELEDRIPNSFVNYHELFVGGGALFYLVYGRHNKSKRYVLNDVNAELMNVYCVVRDRVHELIDKLFNFQNSHSQRFYYEIRARDRDPDFVSADIVERAARFIYLNKTAYNGLYRVNAKSQFNVPFGSYDSPNICDEANLLLCSKCLQDTELLCGDFTRVLEHIQPRDFVYLDPPYIPLSETSSFTSYTSDSFSIDQHLRLREFCDQVDELDAFFLLSNSDTKITREVYAGFAETESIPSRRTISAKVSGRADVSELLVRNFK